MAGLQDWQHPGLPREIRPRRPEVLERCNIAAEASHAAYKEMGLGTTHNGMDVNMDGVLGLEITRNVTAIGK